MENLIRKRFVGQVLQEEGDRLLKNQSAILEKRLIFHTGRLAGRRRISVSGGEEMDGKLSFTHVSYERFLDMKRIVNRKRTTGTRTKRGYRIHNRFVYGTYYAIASRLMYDLTDDVRAKLINDLKNESHG